MKKMLITDKLEEIDFSLDYISLGDFDYIGEYTAKQSFSLETLIIDEGFGSLDTRGREEMTEELRRLGQELNRIILVSHQEEVSNAFNHRYHIDLEDGNSTVSRQF